MLSGTDLKSSTKHRWMHRRVKIERLTLLQFGSKALQAVRSANIPAPCGRAICLSNTGRFFWIQMVTAWQAAEHRVKRIAIAGVLCCFMPFSSENECNCSVVYVFMQHNYTCLLLFKCFPSLQLFTCNFVFSFRNRGGMWRRWNRDWQR